MKRILICILSLAIVGCSSLFPQNPEQTAATVKQSLAEISRLLSGINYQLSGEELKVHEATITLLAEEKASFGGGFDVVASGSQQTGSSHFIKLGFTVIPSEQVIANDINRSIRDVVEHLSEAVNVISKDQGADLKSLTVEMGMNISSDASGGIKVEFFGIGINTEANESSALGNSIKITLMKASGND